MNRESHITEVKLENVEQLHNQQLVNKNYQHFSLSSSKKVTKEFNLTEVLIFRYRECRLSIIWTSYTPVLGGDKIVFYQRDRYVASIDSHLNFSSIAFHFIED